MARFTVRMLVAFWSYTFVGFVRFASGQDIHLEGRRVGWYARRGWVDGVIVHAVEEGGKSKSNDPLVRDSNDQSTIDSRAIVRHINTASMTPRTEFR